MKLTFGRYCMIIVVLAVTLNSCKSSTKANGTSGPAFDPSKEWKLGIGLYTFHNNSYAESLQKVDSAGIKYIEAINFQKAGGDLKDSSVGTLSEEGSLLLKDMAAQKGIHMESMYVGGPGTTEWYVKQFKMAKLLGLRFITSEPPIKMLDTVDSLAGVYGVKVALHNHFKGTSQYWNPDTVLAALKNHPNLGACPDLGHWPKSGIDPVKGLKKFEGHILAIHFKDIAEFNNPKLQDVPIGTGVVNFPLVLQELKRQKYSGNIYLERDAQEKGGNLPSVIQMVAYYNREVSKIR